MFYEVLGEEPVSPEKQEAIQNVLELNKNGGNVIVTSVVSHVEVLPSKLEAKRPGAEAQYLAMFDGARIVDVEISRNILMRAREIRGFYYRDDPVKIMDAGDALHLATATIYEVAEFHTRDDDGRGFKIPLLSLYKWSGTSTICDKYPLKIVSPEHEQKVLDFAARKA